MLFFGNFLYFYDNNFYFLLLKTFQVKTSLEDQGAFPKSQGRVYGSFMKIETFVVFPLKKKRRFMVSLVKFSIKKSSINLKKVFM